MSLQNNKNSICVGALILSTLLFSGCGGGGGGSSSNSSSSSNTDDTGILIDYVVEGAKWKNQSKEGFTNEKGEFPYSQGKTEFYIGTIKVGEITSLPPDKHVYLQDIVGVPRKETNNLKVLKIAKLLQSIDSDPTTDEIEIKEEDFKKFNAINDDISNIDVENILRKAKDFNIVTDAEAKRHLDNILESYGEVEDYIPQELESSSLIGQANVAVNAKIKLTFKDDIPKSKEMKKNIILKEKDGNEVDYDIKHYFNEIIIIPKEHLKYDTKYELKILSHMKDYAKNESSGDNLISFITSNKADTSKPLFITTNTINVDENQTSVLKVKATDNTSVTYSIKDEFDGTSFNINEDSGELKFKNLPDYENKKSYTLIVIASDGINEKEQRITVNINNVDEQAKIINKEEIKDDIKLEDFLKYEKSIKIFDDEKADLELEASTKSNIITLKKKWTNPISYADYNNKEHKLEISSVSNKYGKASVELKVKDSNKTDLKQFLIEVPAVLDFPTISVTDEISLNKNFGEFNITVSNIDLAGASSVTMSALADDSSLFEIKNSSLNTSGEDLVFVLKSKDNKSGVTKLMFQVNNGREIIKKDIKITITDINNAPKISGNPDLSVEATTEYSFTPKGSDVDTNNTLTYIIENKPSWADFDVNTGKLSGIPEQNDIKTFSNIKIGVKDNLDAKDYLPDFSITVKQMTDKDGDKLADKNDPDTNNPDVDSDGIPDGADADINGDGTLDNGKDKDKDGIADKADADDNPKDGKTDTGKTDTDKDGIIDEYDIDKDGDGIPDSEDKNPLNPDVDSDGIPDGVDTDLDNDGIVDKDKESQDKDKDGIADKADADDNPKDGKIDTGKTDTDKDGIIDEYDTDKDGDKLTDKNDPDTNNPDVDSDGIPDGADADINGDGTLDNGKDKDKDGIADKADADDNPKDGKTDTGKTDTDKDGIIDEYDIDKDGDGIPDSEDKNPLNPDVDSDGIPDGVDTDLDNDGIVDKDKESQDKDKDGIADKADADDNPKDGKIDTGKTDTDKDGIIDEYDTDKDGDKLTDKNDPDTNNPDVDSDGIPDGADADINGDGTLDNGKDKDKDGIADKADADDNPKDGKTDTGKTDTDKDGIIDEYDIDKDGDGIPDSEDKNPLIKDIKEVLHNSKLYKVIVSPITKKKWLDKNIGAERQCTAVNDARCFGDYFQWGRLIDGHEKANSQTSNAKVQDINNAGDKFISVGLAEDWQTSRDDNGKLRVINWSKTDGSTVCPVGFRIPTSEELKLETLSFNDSEVKSIGKVKVTNIVTGFDNFLKIPSSGQRVLGTVSSQNSTSGLWTTGINLERSELLFVTSSSATINSSQRGMGFPIRCIGDENKTPKANAGGNKLIRKGKDVKFDASASKDEDGTIVSYEWKEGNNTYSLDETFNKDDFPLGKHNITLIVTDDKDGKDFDSIEVEVISNTITKDGLTYKIIKSPHTGKSWLDRNIGATQECTSATDDKCFGDYFQWGRLNDGHEKITSSSSNTLVTNIMNAGDKFIEGGSDWQKDHDNDMNLRKILWNSTNGKGICPVGFRVPSLAEIEAEITTVDNRNKAYQSFLKLPGTGHRPVPSVLGDSKPDVHLWTNTVDSSNNAPQFVSFEDSGIVKTIANQSFGKPIRCIEDDSNITPSANAGGNKTAIVGDTVKLDASASKDEDGNITKYEWRYPSGMFSTDKIYNKNDFTIGKHDITLYVQDDKGGEGIDVIEIDVISNPKPFKTGQTKSYSLHDDGHHTKGKDRDFTDNGNDTVTDNSSSLMWENTLHINKKVNSESSSYIKNYCTNLSLAGFDDWRLPTIEELHSITHFGASPAIDPTFTNYDAKGSHHFSSTKVYGTPPFANYHWVFSYSNNSFNETFDLDNKGTSHISLSIMCVREIN